MGCSPISASHIEKQNQQTMQNFLVRIVISHEGAASLDHGIINQIYLL